MIVFLFKERRLEHVKEYPDGTRALYISLPIDEIYKESDIHVRYGPGSVLIYGEKDDNSFSRTFPVPKNIDPDNLEAIFQNGVLIIKGPVPWTILLIRLQDDDYIDNPWINAR